MERLKDRPVIRATERTGYAGRQLKPVTYCDGCGRSIYAGDECWEIHEELLCNVCIAEARCVAVEVDRYDYD